MYDGEDLQYDHSIHSTVSS